jgi:hypothetical protein
MLALRSSVLRLAFLSSLVGPTPGCGGEGDEGDGPSEQESEGTDEGEVVDACVRLCNPIVQDCDPGEACLPDQPGFSCRGLPAVEEGTRRGLHDACEAGSQTCNAGLVCLQVTVPGCNDGTGCCVAICDVTQAECTDGTACYPIFDAGLMCYENVGACVLF